MSDFAALDRAALAAEGPTPGSREARGSLAFKALAGLNAAGVILAFFPPITPVPALLVVVFNTGAALLAVLYVVEALGLDRNRPWAIAAMRPMLVLAAVVGVATLVVGFAGGKIRIPFDVAIPVWALLAPTEVKPFPRLSGRSIGLAVATVPLFSLMLFAQPLGGWGGTLDVQQADFRATLQVDCGTGAGGSGVDALGLPTTISVAYDWSWNKAGLLPSGTDIVVIGWTGADAAGHPLYSYDDSPNTGPGILAGLAGYPSTALADQIGRETAASFRWALPLDQQLLAPAHIDLALRRTSAGTPGPKSLVISATYIHEALWRADAPHVTCSW